MKTTKRVTIKDVAALAGVSFATVSRTLDDRPEISEETKERVRAACRQLGYVPNIAARGLTGRATHTLGLLVPDVSRPYYANLVTAIEQEAAINGYRVLLSNSMRDLQQELCAIEDFVARQIDGILISALSVESQALHKQLVGNLPCVYLGANHDEDCSYVMSDNEAGAYEVTRYLLSLGHRDIWLLGGRENSRNRELRTTGFCRALAEEGVKGTLIPAPDNVGKMRNWSYETAKRFLTGPLPDAIFAFSDTTALKVMEAAEEQNIHIPEQLSLVGYDNISFSGLPRIHLTTVYQKEQQQGVLALNRLLAQIGGNRERTVDVLQPELIIRSTCAKK